MFTWVLNKRVQRNPETKAFEKCWPSPCLPLQSSYPTCPTLTVSISYADLPFYFSNTPRELPLQCLSSGYSFGLELASPNQWLTPYHSYGSTNVTSSEGASLTRVTLYFSYQTIPWPWLFSSLYLLPLHQSSIGLIDVHLWGNQGLVYFTMPSAPRTGSTKSSQSKLAHPQSLAKLEWSLSQLPISDESA